MDNHNTYEKILAAIALLKEAGLQLQAEGEIFYNTGDNMRGNIRHDAGRRLCVDADYLTSSFSYLEFALKK